MRSPRILLPIAALFLLHANLHAATHDVQPPHSEAHQHHLTPTRIAYRTDLHHAAANSAQPATTADPTIHPTVLTYLYNLLRSFLGI